MSETFIHEIPLKTTPHIESVLDVRLYAAQCLYNACLGEALRRLDLMRESKAYQAARKLPNCTKKKDRGEAFRLCRETHSFNEYSLHSFAAKDKNACWIGDHLDVNTVQKVATRAWQAVEQYAFGKRGRPRFKRKGTYTSVEGKTNKSGIRWKDGKLQWSGLEISARFDIKDAHGVEAHALNCDVKYVRLVKRTIKGKPCWAVQLVLDGQPHQKEKNVVADDTVGVDIGPSTAAAVGENEAILVQFCEEVIQPWQEIKIDQRTQDRSRRATNPDNYNPDGTVKKGSKKWYSSNRYKKQQIALAEKQRKLAATRKNLHGRLANRILTMGKFVKAEKLSYKSFQKNYGRSVAVRAPGMFVTLLTRKAANAGGSVELLNTRTTKLSQTCVCGTVKKKPLSERHHDCPTCGASAQRDLFSGFLAKHCSDNTLDISRAHLAWPAAKPLLQQAMSRLTQTANRRHSPASFGLARRRSCSPVKYGSAIIEAVDVVATGSLSCESYRKMLTLPLEPPAFRHGEV